MRHIYTFAFVLFSIFWLKAQTAEYLDANDLKVGFSAGVGGTFFNADPTHAAALYEIPKGSGKKAVYIAALWLSALDNGGNLCGATGMYNQSGYDFFDGPIHSTYDTAYQSYYNRVFKITQGQIQQFLTLNFPAQPGAVAGAILQWPGKGNPYVLQTFGVDISDKLAPFVDRDGDGIYNPMLGDYPAICGEQAIFFVFNDDRAQHTSSNCQKLGIEVRGLAEEFARAPLTVGGEKDPINTSVFLSLEVQNKSVKNYHDFKVSLWEDPDLGNFNNDRVGCDTNRSVAFVYNAGNDVNAQGLFGYDSTAIAQGVKFLNNSLTSFAYFTNGGGPNQSDPAACSQYRNYQSGFWNDGTPFTSGGYGINSGGPMTKFIFPSSPSDPNGWSEATTPSLQPGDRRMAATVTLADFLVGTTAHIDLAFVTSYDSTASYNSIVDTLARDADIIQQFYDNQLTACKQQIAADVNEMETSIPFQFHPNPASSTFTIELQNFDFSKGTSILVYDAIGQLQLKKAMTSSITTLDISMLSAGLYLVEVSTSEKRSLRKLLIQR